MQTRQTNFPLVKSLGIGVIPAAAPTTDSDTETDISERSVAPSSMLAVNIDLATINYPRSDSRMYAEDLDVTDDDDDSTIHVSEDECSSQEPDDDDDYNQNFTTGITHHASANSFLSSRSSLMSSASLLWEEGSAALEDYLSGQEELFEGNEDFAISNHIARTNDYRENNQSTTSFEETLHFDEDDSSFDDDLGADDDEDDSTESDQIDALTFLPQESFSTTCSVASYDAISCLTEGDCSYYEYEYDQDESRGSLDATSVAEIRPKRIDPTSRFYRVPARRMSMGEMETVIETVVRSFNSLRSFTREPSERRLSFAAVIHEQAIFDKSAPACELARGCLTRIKGWTTRNDHEDDEDENSEVSQEDDTVVKEHECGDKSIHEFPSVSCSSATIKTQPNRLKSILKLFPRFSKPLRRDNVVLRQLSDDNISCQACPIAINKENNKPVETPVSPRAPVRPHRQLSLRSLFDGTGSNNATMNEDETLHPDKNDEHSKELTCFSSPPQRPRRQLSFRSLFLHQQASSDGCEEVSAGEVPTTQESSPCKLIVRQGSFFGLTRKNSSRRCDGAPKKPGRTCN